MEQQKINEYKQLPIGKTPEECRRNVLDGLEKLKQIFAELKSDENQRINI
jgi:hypothetical protein